MPLGPWSADRASIPASGAVLAPARPSRSAQILGWPAPVRPAAPGMVERKDRREWNRTTLLPEGEKIKKTPARRGGRG